MGPEIQHLWALCLTVLWHICSHRAFPGPSADAADASPAAGKLQGHLHTLLLCLFSSIYFVVYVVLSQGMSPKWTQQTPLQGKA